VANCKSGKTKEATPSLSKVISPETSSYEVGVQIDGFEEIDGLEDGLIDGIGDGSALGAGTGIDEGSSVADGPPASKYFSLKMTSKPSSQEFSLSESSR